MKMKFFLLILLIMFIFSCRRKTTTVISDFRDVDISLYAKDVQELQIDESSERTALSINIPHIANENVFLKLSAFVDSIEYIKLENIENSEIGVIDKIDIKHDTIYILDRYKTKSLKRFSLKGKYIDAIGNMGEGPTEYNEPTDFILTDKNIILFDQFKCRLMFFNLDGTYLYSKKSPFLFLKFHQFSENQYIFYSLDADNDHLSSILNYAIIQSDSSFMVKNKAFYRDKTKSLSFYNETNFSPQEDKILYHPPFNDTIFSISSSNKVAVEYIINFSDKTIPNEYLLLKNRDKFLKEMRRDNYISFSGTFFELEKYLFLAFQKKTLNYNVIYNKINNTIQYGSIMENDINLIFPFSNIKYAYDNTLVGYFSPSELLARTDMIDTDILKKQIGEKGLELLSQMKYDDNPYLLFFHLKN